MGLPEYSLRDGDSVLSADDMTEEAFAEFDKYCRRTEIALLDHVMRGPAEARTPAIPRNLFSDPEDDAALMDDIFRYR
jgi:hypothetical protein